MWGLRAIRLGLVVLLLAVPLAVAQEGPAPVEVDPVRVQPFEQTAAVLGRIVTRQQGPVAARVAGRVDRVAVEVGDRVARGEPLVHLDEALLRIERDLAEAEAAAAEAERATAEARVQLLEGERARLERLRGSAAFSGAQLADKENEIAVARRQIEAAGARVAQVRTRLARADQDLEDATIDAPFQGVVSVRHVSPGAYVRIGDPVVTLIDDSALEIEADVPTDRLAALDPGIRVAFTLDDGTRHEATVRAQVPEENPMTRTRAVRFTPTFGETEKPLGVAQSVTLDLPTGVPREVVSVHKDAVIQRPEGAMVFVVENGEAEPRPIVTGEAVGGRLEVEDGLEPGELVVIRGNERLRPGQAVTHPEPPQARATGARAGS